MMPVMATSWWDSKSPHWQRSAVLLGVAGLVVAGIGVWLTWIALNRSEGATQSGDRISATSSFDGPIVKIEGSLGLANVTAGDTLYSVDGLQAAEGDVVKVQIMYNNLELDDSGLFAESLGVKLNLFETEGGTELVARVFAANANTVEMSTTVRIGNGLRLDQILNSVVWQHNVGSKGNVRIVDDKISDSVIGDGLVLGDVPPLYEFAGSVTVLVRVVAE